MARVLQQLKEIIVLLLCALCIITEITFIFMPLNVKGFTVDSFIACVLKSVLFASEKKCAQHSRITSALFQFLD